jgi:hypothetical protein
MGSITIQYNGNELYFLRKKIESAVDQFANITAEKIEDGIESEAPVKSGALYRSFKTRPMGRFTAKVYTNLHYAAIVNDGRGAIVAPPGGSLNFRMNGQMVHVSRVGPAKANPYVKRGTDRATKFDTYFDQALREVGL